MCDLFSLEVAIYRRILGSFHYWGSLGQLGAARGRSAGRNLAGIWPELGRKSKGKGREPAGPIHVGSRSAAGSLGSKTSCMTFWTVGPGRAGLRVGRGRDGVVGGRRRAGGRRWRGQQVAGSLMGINGEVIGLNGDLMGGKWMHGAGRADLGSGQDGFGLRWGSLGLRGLGFGGP